MRILFELYLTFFKIGLFTIGGGMASLPLIEDIIVNGNNWISISDFLNLITLSEMSPGPIAINAATFVGMKVGGVLGAIIATLGNITPSLIIIFTLSILYYKFKSSKSLSVVVKSIRPTIVGILISVVIGLVMTVFNLEVLVVNPIEFFLMFGMLGFSYFVLTKFKKLSPINLIFLMGLIGIVVFK